MNKETLVEAIRGKILQSEPTDDNTRVLHYKRVETAVIFAFNELITYLDKTDDAEIETHFVKTYMSQEVKKFGNFSYVVLPAKIISLPQGRGVWYVKPTGQSEHIIHATSLNGSLFSTLPVGKTFNDTTYYMSSIEGIGDAIIFNHIGDSSKKSLKYVDIGLVRDFESYTDTELVDLPGEKFSFVVEKCLAWFGKRATDKSNNNR